MDTLDEKYGRPDNIIASPELSKHISTFGNWGSFLAIVYFIGIGLMYIASLALILGSPLFEDVFDHGFRVTMGLIYIIVATLLLIPTLRFFKSCRLAIQVARTASPEQATLALKNLASSVKIFGIYGIIYLGILVLSFISSLLFSTIYF